MDILVKDDQVLATAVATLRDAGCLELGLALKVVQHTGNRNLPHHLFTCTPTCSNLLRLCSSTFMLADKVDVLTFNDFSRQSSVSQTLLRPQRLGPRRLSLYAAINASFYL